MFQKRKYRPQSVPKGDEAVLTTIRNAESLLSLIFPAVNACVYDARSAICQAKSVPFG